MKITKPDTLIKEKIPFKHIETNEAFQEMILFTDKEIKFLKHIKQSIRERLEEDRRSSDKLKNIAQTSRSSILNDFVIEKVVT